jgi:hypothetical protein
MNCKACFWIFMAGFGAASLGPALPAQASNLEQTIQSCVSVAQEPHGTYLLQRQSYTDNRYHIARMSGLCAAWGAVAAQDRAALLRSCQHEAKGMVRGLRASATHGGHVLSLQGHCQRLYDLTQKSS